MAYNTGATFYPGGEDSFYLPEVVSPAPQRLNEHPTNIEQNVAHMEQQAQRTAPRLSTQLTTGQQGHTGPWSPASPIPNPYAQPNYGGQQAYQTTAYGQNNLKPPPEQPNFSPFPKVQNRGNKVPSDVEEQEAHLESAREAVLASDNVDMQLMWAQDTLAFCEIAIQNEQRVSQTQPARPRTPRVEHMLREDAMRIVEFLAEQHQPKAEFLRGMWLEFGKFGYRIDKREAFNCYTRASERGFTRAYYRIGMQFENSNDALKAIKYYQIGVNLGDAASSYRLGMMTLLGQHGQPQDFDRGLQLIYTAASGADENAPQGAYVLGMLQAGELSQVNIPERLLPRNLSQARTNIEKAAFLGFAKAQVRMGTAYELGDLGCSFDAALSLHYNSLAARQGEVDADMAISKWFLCGQEGVFSKNEEMAFTYAQRAAVGGLATAQFAMGYFYEVGIYVQTDLKQAREWYSKAAENGNEDASKRISAISRSKTISRKDHENVALQKIREQHASAGGASQLPSVQERPASAHPQSPTIDMPDPSRLSLNNNVQRPASTAPYPDGPSPLPNPNFRPTSAFGFNPALQQQQRLPSGPLGHGPTLRPDPLRVSSAPAAQQQRPYVNYDQGAQGPGYGRGGRPQGPPGPGYQHGAENPQYAGPQGLPSQQRQQPRPGAQQSPKVDIGFSAPLDPSGPDGRDPNRRRPNASQQGGPPGGPGPQGPGSNRPPRMDSHGRPTPGPGTPRPAGAGAPSQQPRPPKQQQQYHNPPPSNVQAARIEPTRPPRADSATPKPTQQKPQTVSASTAASKPQGPGKGPKTFDEMGVPQAKKDGDCIVM